MHFETALLRASSVQAELILITCPQKNKIHFTKLGMTQSSISFLHLKYRMLLTLGLRSGMK